MNGCTVSLLALSVGMRTYTVSRLHVLQLLLPGQLTADGDGSVRCTRPVIENLQSEGAIDVAHGLPSGTPPSGEEHVRNSPQAMAAVVGQGFYGSTVLEVHAVHAVPLRCVSPRLDSVKFAFAQRDSMACPSL